MMKLKIQDKRILGIIVLEALFAILFARTFSIWFLMCTFWLGLGSLIIWKKFDKNLTFSEKRLWIIILFSYPIVESAIKAFIYLNVIPYSYRPLNIIEHFMWSVTMCFMIYPIIKNYLKKESRFIVFFVIVGLIVTIGNLNEFFEFIIRVAMDLTSQKYFAAYYSDTLIDLLNNLVGGIIGAGLLIWPRKQSKENSEVDFGVKTSSI